MTDFEQRAGVRQGRIDIASLPLAEDAAIHVCGPLPVLSATIDGLLGRGVPAERIHYEVFDPDLFAGRLACR